MAVVGYLDGYVDENNREYGLTDTVAQGLITAIKDGSSIDSFGDVETALDSKVDNSKIGANNGIAELDANGRVPSSQLPSYVDDVLEYASQSAFPATGETGKIYIALDTNKTYRWSGFAYVEISESLALGETSSTAYAGNKGKANADAIAAMKDGSSIDSFGDVETALEGKQDTLTFDNVPTDGSNNPVKSNGIYDAIDDVYKANGVLGTKNLFEPVVKSGAVINGITYSFQTDGVHLSGTADGISTANICGRYGGSGPFRSFKNGSYIVSGGLVDKNISLICGITKNGAFYELGRGTGDISIAIDGDDGSSDSAYLLISISVPNGVNADGVIINPMVRLGTDSDSTFVPYAMTNRELTGKITPIDIYHNQVGFPFTAYTGSATTFESMENGMWYLSGTQMSSITDKPSTFTGGRCFLMKTKSSDQNIMVLFGTKDNKIWVKFQYSTWSNWLEVSLS